MARDSTITRLADVAVGVVQLNPELQLVADFNPLGVCILQTAGQCLRHV